MAKQPNQNNGNDTEMFYLLVVVMVAAIVWGVWNYARPVLVYFSFGLDLVQFAVLSLVSKMPGDWGTYYEIAKAPFGLSDTYKSNEIDWNKIEFTTFKDMSELAGALFKFIFAFLIGAMAITTLFKMKGNGFARTFTLTGGKGKGPSLAHYQAQHWKVFSAGAFFNPDDLSNKAELPSKTPMEWMQENNVSLTESEGLDPDTAQYAFTQQLGEPWHGYDKAPTYIQVLCFLFYINAKRDKNSRKLKEEFTLIWSQNKPEIAAKKSIIRLKELTKKDDKFKKIIDKNASIHAYTNTALYKLLDWARKNGGVFASAEFRWLKPIDRTLWYVLNNCGRRAFHIEGAGAISHFHAEHILKQALSEPHVDEAVDGLEDYLDGQGLMDLEEFFNNENKAL